MNGDSKRILCVDDDVDNCQMLEVLFNRAGFEVVSVNTAEDAVSLAESQKFNLYVLDLWLKNQTGADLCRRIRENDERTPIIIYSADARTATRQNLADCNVQAFLIKPTGLSSLIGIVNRLTQNQQGE